MISDLEMEKERSLEEKTYPPDKDVDEEIPVTVSPPDGGWGWCVVFASFMCNVIVDGIIFSYGLFLPDLAAAFGETKGRVAWVGSLLAGFYLIAGPLVSGLANTYGCRPVTIIGTIISSISFVLASFAPNMEYLCVTFGLMGGIGFGFIYLPAVVTVGFYFEKKRAFATGLAVCGSGVGTFVMAPLVKILLEKYAWRGTMLILAGIILHCAVFGILFRPLAPESRKKVMPKPPPLLQRIKDYRENLRKWSSEDFVDCSALPATDESSNIAEATQSTPVLNGLERLVNDNTNSPTGSNNSPPPSYSEVVGEEMFSFLGASSKHQPITVKSTFHKSLNRENKKRYLVRENYLRPFYRQDILYSASLLHLPEFQSQPDLEHYHMSITKIPVYPEGETSRSCLCFSPVMKETFKQMLDLSLLKSPTFLIFGLGGFLTLAGFFVPFMYVIDRAVICGISPDEATYILPAIGLTNTIGRIFSGWASDRPRLNALSINNLALISGGLITIFSPFMNSFPLLLIYGAVFGFSIACFATLRSIIVVELLGLEKLTNAFGLLLLFQGVASIIGAPVAGMFFDMTGSYDASFFIAGSVILISGLLGMPLPYISRWEKRRKAMKLLPLEEPQIIITPDDEDGSNTPQISDVV